MLMIHCSLFSLIIAIIIVMAYGIITIIIILISLPIPHRNNLKHAHLDFLPILTHDHYTYIVHNILKSYTNYDWCRQILKNFIFLKCWWLLCLSCRWVVNIDIDLIPLCSPPEPLMPRSHIHRAPHDCSCPVLPGGLPWILETVRLPCEFNFCGVCGHIFYDVRAVPFKHWKSLIVRRP